MTMIIVAIIVTTVNAYCSQQVHPAYGLVEHASVEQSVVCTQLGFAQRRVDQVSNLIQPLEPADELLLAVPLGPRLWLTLDSKGEHERRTHSQRERSTASTSFSPIKKMLQVVVLQPSTQAIV